MTIPSLHARPGEHPFSTLAREMRAVTPPPPPPPPPLVAAAAVSDRTVRSDRFALDPPTDLAGEHVLILDDTWTTGAQAQSAARAVRAAGAEWVSVLVVGRWLNPDYRANARFRSPSDSRPTTTPYRCPVTGGHCP